MFSYIGTSKIVKTEIYLYISKIKFEYYKECLEKIFNKTKFTGDSSGVTMTYFAIFWCKFIIEVGICYNKSSND